MLGVALRFAVPACACFALVACATAGDGTNPPLPGVALSDDASLADDASPGDPSSGDDSAAADPGDGAAAPSGSTCGDSLHGLRALFVLPPVPCSRSTDCAAGDCCYVGTTASTCVMQ
jgi:hypothetical protein